MKKILCIAMALQLACTTYAGDLLVDVKNHVSADVRNRRVTITLLQPGPVVQGPWLIAGDAVAQLTSASGTTTFSNLLAGAYRLDIAGTPGRSFPFAMPDTNGLVNVSSLIGATNINPLFYTASQVDTLLDEIDVVGGDNITVERDGRTFTVSGQGLGGGVNAAEVAAIMATNTAGSASAVAANVTNQWMSDINSASNELREFALTIDPSYWINVKNFGAVGDGVTDDTDAITAAYEVFNDEAEHRVLYFPAGKYLDYGQRSIGAAAADAPVHTRATRSVIGDGERTVILAWGTNGPYLSTTNRAVYLHGFILSGPQSTNSSTPLSVVSGKASGIALFGSDARPVLSRLTVQWFPRYGIFLESYRGPILHDVWAHGNKVGIGIGRGTHGLDASVRFSLCSIGMEFGAQSSNVVDNLPAMVSDGPGGNRVHFSSYGCDIGILMDYPAPGTKFSGTFVSIGHEPFLFGRYSRSLWRPGTSTIDSDWTIPPTASSAETMEVAVDALYIAATPGTASNVFNVRVPTKLTISNSRFNHTAPTPFLRVYSGAGGSVVYRQNVTVSSNNFVGDASYTLFDYGDARGWTNYYSTNLVGSYVGSPLTLTSERLLGRNTASAGPVEEISIGTGLELSGGVLSATGEGGEATNVLHLAASDSIGIATNDLLRTPFLTEAVTNYFLASATNTAEALVNTASNALRDDILNVSYWINVMDYGATGNGSTDDTAAIQTALDAATNSTAYGGRTMILFPAGHYVISDTLRLRTYGTSIKGAGTERTRIRTTSNTADGFSVDVWPGGWNFGGGTNNLWYMTFEDFKLEKSVVPYTTGTSAGMRFQTGIASAQRLSRSVFRNVKVSGFYWGFFIEHSVGTLWENVEAYGNNFAYYLVKADSATFLNCFGGDAIATVYGTNIFSAPYSAVWTTTNNGYAGGFVCTVIGGEARNAESIWDHGSGALNVIGANVEFAWHGPPVHVRAGAHAAFFSGLRIAGRNAGSTNAVFKIGAGRGAYTRIEPGNYSDSSTYPQIEIATAGDAVHYAGPNITVTNLGSETSYTLNRTTLAATPGILLTNSPSSWTLYSVSTNESRHVSFGSTVSIGTVTLEDPEAGGALHVSGTIVGDAGFTGSGAGLTNIPRDSVNGLETALDYLTNNIGGEGSGPAYWFTNASAANSITNPYDTTIIGTLTNIGTFHFTNTAAANRFVNFNGSIFRVNQTFNVDNTGNATATSFLGVLSPGGSTGGYINGDRVASTRATVWLRPGQATEPKMLFALANASVGSLTTLSTNWPALTPHSFSNASPVIAIVNSDNSNFGGLYAADLWSSNTLNIGGLVTLTNLAGTGTRMVTVTETGQLGYDDIPSGGESAPVTNLFSGTTVTLGNNYSISTATNIYLTAVTAPASGTYGQWQLTVHATSDITLTNMGTILASDFLKTRTITNGNRATISIEVQPGVYTNMSIVQFR